MDQINDEQNFSIEDINNGAKIGFDIVKNKLNKQTITPADCLGIFLKLDPIDANYTSIFLISIVMLDKIKHKLDNDDYNKLFNYIVSKFIHR